MRRGLKGRREGFLYGLCGALPSSLIGFACVAHDEKIDADPLILCLVQKWQEAAKQIHVLGSREQDRIILFPHPSCQWTGPSPFANRSPKQVQEEVGEGGTGGWEGALMFS